MGRDEEHMLEKVSIMLNCISWANSFPYTICFPCTPGGHDNVLVGLSYEDSQREVGLT